MYYRINFKGHKGEYVPICPYWCTKDHSDIASFQDKELEAYFEKNQRLYGMKCVKCKKIVIPNKGNMVLVCVNASRGCKRGIV
eukprot:12656770-Ditylum_brightwellii.AAC.1